MLSAEVNCDDPSATAPSLLTWVWTRTLFRHSRRRARGIAPQTLAFSKWSGILVFSSGWRILKLDYQLSLNLLSRFTMISQQLILMMARAESLTIVRLKGTSWRYSSRGDGQVGVRGIGIFPLSIILESGVWHP